MPDSIDLIPGTEVHARGMRWEVALTQPMGPQTLLRLRGLDGPFLGREIDLLHPFEEIQPVIHDFSPESAAPLRYWQVYHQAFLLEQAPGADVILSIQPGRLKIEPYQLVPVLRAIRLSRPRLLLADGVGLGKTIQAGLILTELLARRLAHRILIVSPAGPLLEQWRTEMLERFGLRATVLDRAKLDEIRRSTELGANPFDQVAIGLASMDFLKQETVLAQLERATYDVVVIDEAHHCMDAGSLGDREDSQRRRMAETLATRCDCLLLATATPHDGNDRSFASLCELLDYSLVDGKGCLRGQRYTAHVVRRLKDHIKDPETGAPKFRDRQVIPVPVAAAGDRYRPFRILQQTLIGLVGPELQRALRARRYHDVLSFIALLKRSVSSVAACRSTLAVVAARFGQLQAGREESQEEKRQRLRSLRDYNRRLERYGTLTAEEEHERDCLEAEDLAQSLAALQRELRSGRRQIQKFTDLHEGLEALLSLADNALATDPKLDQILAEIRAIRQAEPDANVLVYTEYTTTQDALVRFLQASDVGTVLSLCGDDDDGERATKTERFRTESPLVLVSTDAAAEGLNLHARCHHLLHVELPFNPNRLEQRNGRIDRYGQTLDPVVRYLYLTPSFEERILLRLIAKYERQRSRLTFVPNTLGGLTSSEALTTRLLQGLSEEEGWLIKETPEPYFSLEQAAENEGTDTATRELLEEIDRSMAGFEKAARTHSWLAGAGLNAETARVAEADQAMHRGQRESTVDLAHFVSSAVMLSGGRMKGGPDDPFFSIVLPPGWRQGAVAMPGYDAAGEQLRLTVRMDVTHTPEGASVAFLGRGHPVVRRALDGVRHAAFGGKDGRGLDVRVSAVSADVPAPELLFTYLGRVKSRAGRAFERVLAVRMSADKQCAFLPDAADWMGWISQTEAITTTDCWKLHFSENWTGAMDEAARQATSGFAPIAGKLVQDRQRDMERELTDLDAWLRQRTEDLTGQPDDLAQQQELDLADSAIANQGSAAAPPPWRSLTVPQERLAAFVADGKQPHARRHEADGVLRLYKLRADDLDARSTMNEPEIIPLGLLMILPKEQA